MAGLFFCLASAEGAGLFFLPGGVQAKYKRLQHVLCSPCRVIQHTLQNSSHGFTGAFPLICPIPAHTIQQTHKPPIHRLRHAGGHTVKRCTSTDTRHYRHAGHCTGQRSRPIIIRYIRVQGSAWRLEIWHRVSNQSMAGRGQEQGRGTTGGLPPHLFSGFRPIANKGQQ